MYSTVLSFSPPPPPRAIVSSAIAPAATTSRSEGDGCPFSSSKGNVSIPPLPPPPGQPSSRHCGHAEINGQHAYGTCRLEYPPPPPPDCESISLRAGILGMPRSAVNITMTDALPCHRMHPLPPEVSITATAPGHIFHNDLSRALERLPVQRYPRQPML